MKIQKTFNDSGLITDCVFILEGYTTRTLRLIMALVHQDKLTHGYYCEYTWPNEKGPVRINITNGVVQKNDIEAQEALIEKMKKECSTEIEKECSKAYSMLRIFKALKDAGELNFLKEENGKNKD